MHGSIYTPSFIISKCKCGSSCDSKDAVSPTVPIVCPFVTFSPLLLVFVSFSKVVASAVSISPYLLLNFLCCAVQHICFFYRNYL